MRFRVSLESGWLNSAVSFAILRLCSAWCHMPVGPSKSTDFKLKVLLKYSLWWGVALKNYLGHHYWTQSCRGSCPVLVLDLWIGIVKWKDAPRTRSKPSFFVFCVFFLSPRSQIRSFVTIGSCFCVPSNVGCLSNGNIFPVARLDQNYSSYF